MPLTGWRQRQNAGFSDARLAWQPMARFTELAGQGLAANPYNLRLPPQRTCGSYMA